MDPIMQWKLDINFFVDGDLLAQRGWHAAPRVGDEVMIGPDSDKTPYSVVRVVWGVEGHDYPPYRQCVNIEIKPVS